MFWLLLYKFSITISESYGYCLKNIFKEIEDAKVFENAISFLKEIGYNGVSLPLMFNMDLLVNKGKEILSSYQMEVSDITTCHYNTLLDYSLISNNAAIRARALNIAIAGLSVSNTLEAPLMIGLLRGRIAGDEKSMIWMQASLKILDKNARDLNVKVLIEPINRYETSYINTISDAYEIIKKMNLENIGIAPNTFHMNIEERNLREPIESAKDKIWHIKVSDSNRWPLGYGHLDFAEIIRTLRKIDYRGWLTTECLPKPSQNDAAIASIGLLKRVTM
ncbi:MAG: sugar phosphate isomerase/epimerase family protein [Nitrososphaeria archaeon]